MTRGMASKALIAFFFGFAALFAGNHRAAAQSAEWFRVETAHFVAYGNVGERGTTEAARRLEVFDGALRCLVPPTRESATKLDVYILRGRDDLREVWPDIVRDALGFYTARPQIVAAFALYRDQYGIDGQEVLFHEYAHHYMLHYFAQAYPPWFVEGFAELVMTAEIGQDRAVFGKYNEGRALSLVGGPWLGIDRMLDSHRRSRLTGAQLAQFYAQSWLMAHFLMLNPERHNGLQAYMGAFQSGRDPIESLQPSLGMSPEEFERALRQYARGNLPLYAAPVQVASEVQIAALPPAANELLLLDARLRMESGEGAGEVARRVEAVAARFPTEPIALRARARAALARASPSEARGFLDVAITQEPENLDANYLLGLSYLVEANAAPADTRSSVAAQSRRHFSRAFRLDETHVPTLFGYARSFLYDDDPMPASARDVLLAAYALAPNVEDIAVTAAWTLMLAGEFQQAVQLLRPVAYQTHRTNDSSVGHLLAVAELASRRAEWRECANPGQRYAPGVQVAGCDAVIGSASERPVDLARAHTYRGDGYAAQRDLERAISDYGEALRLDPQSAYAFHRRGGAHYNQGNFAAAIADFSEAIRLDLNNVEALADRGAAYHDSGDFARAIADLDQAIRLAPGDAGLFNSRCWARAVWGRALARARTDCDAALQLQPNSPAILDSRGLVSLKQRRWNDAWADYDAAIRLSADFASAIYGRGVAAIGLGRIADGQADMARASQLDADIAQTFAGYGVSQ